MLGHMRTTIRVALTVVVGMGASSSGILPTDEATEPCEFPPGTALEFAGRATTAELGVEEVPGDPLSDEPADIVITREEYVQGDQHGRLVCAYYVNENFVEVTIHPDDLEPVVEGPEQPVPEPAEGISEEEAVAIGRAEVPEGDAWRLAVAEAGPIEQVMYGAQAFHDWARDLPADTWAWRVFLVRDGEGATVIIDYADGTVYGLINSLVST